MVKKLKIKSFYFDFSFDLNFKIKSNLLTFNLNHQNAITYTVQWSWLLHLIQIHHTMALSICQTCTYIP